MNLDEQLDFVIQKIAEQEQEVTDNMVRQLKAIQNRLRSNRDYMGESGRSVLGSQYRPTHSPPPPPQPQRQQPAHVTPAGYEYDQYGQLRRN